jgi:hypothetical protein
MEFRRWHDAPADQKEPIAREQIAHHSVRELFPPETLRDPAAAIMPNGKRGRDCTPEEFGDMAEWLQAICKAAVGAESAVTMLASAVGFRI